MKKIIALFMMSLIIVSQSWTATLYVDPMSGDDDDNGSVTTPFQHIWKAINEASDSDVILLKSGDYYHEGFRKVQFPHDSDPPAYRNVYINVDKSVTLQRLNASYTPRIVGYYNTMAESDSLENSYLVHIDDSSVEINYIKFDGYNFFYHSGYNGYTNPDSVETMMPLHNTIAITVDGTNAEVYGCEFKHFGRGLLTSGSSDYVNQAIIGAWCPYNEGPINGVKINNNTFWDNHLDSHFGHEIYLTRRTNAEIKDNTIYSSGLGTPIKLRNECSNILIENNYVLGASFRGFVNGWKDDGQSYPSGIKLINNVFSDSTGTYGADMSVDTVTPFKGPFTPNTHVNSIESAFITEFSGNIIGDLISYPASQTHLQDTHYVHGVCVDSDGVYMASAADNTMDFVHYFPQHAGPLSWRKDGYTDFGDYCVGDLCTTEDYIFTAAKNSSNQFTAWRCNKQDGATGDTAVDIAVSSSMPITAMSSTNLSGRFLTAVRDGGYAKIFVSAETDLDAGTVWQSSAIDSVTAIAHNGSTVTFVGYINGTSTYYQFTLVSAAPYYITAPASCSTCNYYIPAITYLGNDLISARGGTSLYKGTPSNPFTTFLESTDNSNIKVVSMAGYDTGTEEYLYTVLNNNADTTDEINKKLYYNDDDTAPFDDVLFFSHWWGDTEEE